MGKEKPGFLTPKAIANRIKSKGLQKLRWYCQMCEKQCRDENGFKCHLTSESHQRQLLLFGDNSRRFLDEFSRDFKNGFLLTLRHRFGTKRVNANQVYQEYISDRNHIHMNATKWMTLTRFVGYLGRESICHVDQTEKGWFIAYIDRDPETLRRQEELEKKRKLDVDDRERQIIYIEKQIEREKAKDVDGSKKPQFTELQRPTDDGAIKLTFKKMKLDDEKSSKSSRDGEEASKSEEIDEYASKEDDNSSSSSSENEEEKEKRVEKQEIEREKRVEKEKTESKNVNLAFKKPLVPVSSSRPSTSAAASNVFVQAEKRKQSAIDEIMHAKEIEREKQNRRDYWLHKNIIVKIITNKLGEKYYGKKGIVMGVKDSYIGIIKLIENDTILKVDQAHVETVLPAVGKKVLVVNGAYRGLEAILEDIDSETFTAKISIAAGPLKGRVCNSIQYEDISKLYVEENK